MSLNTLLDLNVNLFDDGEELEDYRLKFKETWADSLNEIKDINMEEASGEDCELLLTDYLLNFDEEDIKDCSYDGNYSSGVECSDDHDEGEVRSLASLKVSLKKTRNDSDGKSKESLKSKKNTEVWKGVSAKKVSEKSAPKANKDLPDLEYELVGGRELQKREKDRARSKNYRANKTHKLHQAEEECNELREDNKLLCKKNEELTEKISSLEEQVEYLKGIITNQSALSSILNTLTKHSGLEFQRNPLTCNSMKRKRQDNWVNEDENNCPKNKSLSSDSLKNGGICLHLAPGRMSLEFCKECHKNSNVAAVE